MNSDTNKLMYRVLNEMLKLRDIGEWASHVKSILLNTGFGYVRHNQGVENEKTFLNIFEQRCPYIYIQQCFEDINNSGTCGN